MPMNDEIREEICSLLTKEGVHRHQLVGTTFEDVFGENRQGGEGKRKAPAQSPRRPLPLPFPHGIAFPTKKSERGSQWWTGVGRGKGWGTWGGGGFALALLRGMVISRLVWGEDAQSIGRSDADKL
ncbi:MAG TPA: hypothetical protein VFU49_13845 [Ktedonobacteraceae bacterium]|nr:hypothetical protein [Ktedonobacteraceae bacterium]